MLRPHNKPLTPVIENSVDFKTIFEALPGSFVILQPDPPYFTILAMSDELLRNTAHTREDVVGRSVFEAFPQNPDARSATGPSNLKTSLEHAILYKQQNQMPTVRYDILNAAGIFEARYWLSSSKPVLNAEGEVPYIIHSTADVTHQIEAEKSATSLRNIEKTYSLFMQAPVAICIVSGPENRVELANDEMLSVLGRKLKDF